MILDKIARDYIKSWSTQDTREQDYFADLQDLVDTSPKDALEVMEKIVHEVDDRTISILAAGEFENLLHREDIALCFEQINDLARRDTRWRMLLCGANTSSIKNLDIRNSIEALKDKYKKI